MKIGIFNFKGGCGKSTLTSHIGFYAEDIGKRITIVDADRQCNTMSWLSGHEWDASDEFKLNHIRVTTNMDYIVSEEFVVVDTPPQYEVVSTFPDLDCWIIPVDGRFSVSGAIAVMADIKNKGNADIVLVNNKAYPNTRFGRSEIDQAHKLGAKIFKLPIPQAEVFRRAEMMGCALWNVPYGARAAATQNMRIFCEWVVSGMNDRGVL